MVQAMALEATRPTAIPPKKTLIKSIAAPPADASDPAITTPASILN